jgi:nucleoside-diphosphate-sugar epimerase
MGAEPAPAELRRHWDVVVHSAASTRWTMTRDEALRANVRTTEAALALADADTHLVHVSTAYVEHRGPAAATPADSPYEGYRNGYEWSKAESERVVRAGHAGPLSIVRPPLVFGRSTDGAIARFSGPYTMVQALVSGLAPAVVGDPDGYVEIAGVDQVAAAILDTVSGPPPERPVVGTVAAGPDCLRLAELVAVVCRTLDEWRAERGIAPLAVPPFVAARRWHRFFLPMAARHLSEVQLQAVRLLGMFESYTSMPEPFEPTWKVERPAELLARSIRWWADAKPRHARRLQQPWTAVAP